LVSPRPFLGITASSIREGQEYAQGVYAPCNAVYVVTVQKNGAANGVLEVGDLIVSVDGRSATDINVLLNLLNQYSIGDRVTLKIIRDGRERNVSVTLKAYQAE
jgi:PDZ domain-containing protein